MRQQEILGDLLSAEDRRSEQPKSRDTAGSRLCNHWSAPVLLERVQYLRKLARFGDGSAIETLREFPGHTAMLSVRLRSGSAEINEEFAQILMVLEGRATLATGGATNSMEESGATQISGGSQQELRTGDVVHLAAGTPFQIMLTEDRTLSYLVIMVKECEAL